MINFYYFPKLAEGQPPTPTTWQSSARWDDDAFTEHLVFISLAEATCYRHVPAWYSDWPSMSCWSDHRRRVISHLPQPDIPLLTQTPARDLGPADTPTPLTTVNCVGAGDACPQNLQLGRQHVLSSLNFDKFCTAFYYFLLRKNVILFFSIWSILTTV